MANNPSPVTPSLPISTPKNSDPTSTVSAPAPKITASGYQAPVGTTQPIAPVDVPVADTTFSYALNGVNYNKAGQPIPTATPPPGTPAATVATPATAPIIAKSSTASPTTKPTINTDLFLKPGETIAQYTARIAAMQGNSSGTPSTASTGFVSPADQSAIAKGMSSMSPTDLASGGSALAGFTAASGSTGDDGTIMAQIESEINDIQTQASTPTPSLVAAYNDIIQSSGLSATQASLLNIENVMNGTVSDIRAELTNAGGFATESQIQALAAARNSSLQLQYTSLQNALTLQQKYVDSYMSYYGTDLSNATAAANEKFTLTNTLFNTLTKLQSTDATAQYRFQTQQMNQLKVLLDAGGLANASPAVLASYSATTGIPIETLQSAATNDSAKFQLSLALQNANIAYKDARITPGGTLTSSKVQSFVAAGIPSSVANEIYGYLQQGTDLNTIRTTLGTEYGQSTGFGYLDTFMPIFQSGSNQKKFTATDIPTDVEQQLTSDISSGNYTPQQLINAYPDVDSSYISSLSTQLAQ